jgi:cytoskeletal protein CcmA (bactofilin family)
MGAEPKGRQIELICPKCQNQQYEPSLVVSTLCRSCGNHMNIRDGKPVVRPKHATRLSSASKPPLQHASTGSRAPKKTDSRDASGRGFLRRLFEKAPVMRGINCYHCKFPFEVSSEAQSTQCRKCGGHISLRDYEINQAWRRRIQTRGNVNVGKTGSIIGVHVQCHDLTILGKLAAAVDCSGVLRIRSHGKIIGNVRCRELRVERGAEVEFQGEVYAERAYLDGHVKAQLTCSGTITLEKKAHLQGLARAGGLIVKAGAKHTGLMEVVQPQIAG